MKISSNQNQFNNSQFKESQLIDDKIDELLLQYKIEEERSKEFRDELNDQEESYVTYLEQRIMKAENRIGETKLVVNNKSIKEESEMRVIKDLNKRIEKLIQSKESEQTKLITQGLNEDLKEYIYKLQEENKRLIEERNEYELKYYNRNKQIQMLIGEIKLHKRNDKYFQDVIMNKEKQQQSIKSLQILDQVQNEAVKRIEFIEKNKQKNIVLLPKMEKQYEQFIKNEPINFWRQDIYEDVVQSIHKKHQKFKSLKEIVPYEDLWVIEQEKQKKIEAEKEYEDKMDELNQIKQVQSQKINDEQYLELSQLKQIPDSISYNMLSVLEPQYNQENERSQNNVQSMNENYVNKQASKVSIKSNKYYSDPNDIANKYQKYQYQNKQ